MKSLKIIFTMIFLFGFNLAFGLDAPQNVTLEKANDNSLELSWDKVDGAGVYSISYGEKTASGSSYENDQAEILSTNSGIIKDLKSDTKYFIAVKAYDDNNDESEYSKEVNFSTLKKAKELKIDSVEVLDTRNFNIKFNLDLNKDSAASLNIVNSGDDLEDVEVENYKIEKNILKVTLNKDLKLKNKYSVTVITLEGANGEKIKSGVNGICECFIDENVKIFNKNDLDSSNTDLNSAGSNSGETIEENSTKNIDNSMKNNKTEEKEIKKSTKTLGGKVVDNKNITEKVAKNKKNLPTTGPTETFLFLLFALIAGGLFMNLRRKTSL